MSSNFQVSAIKYRPKRFEDVVGQQQVTETLKNAIKENKLAHSFLFCGPRGVGKTTCARILAKVINCENLSENQEACGECSSCKGAENSSSFNIFELDAASNNSVDDMRQLIEQVRFAPQQGQYKVYIIDEVHMLSASAFNAFLKTLEEPPSYAIFILATTEKHKIIPTILSRCQIFDFSRIQVPDIVNHLKGICATEGIEAEDEALHMIAQKADGALRDSLSIFDRLASFSEGPLTAEHAMSSLNILDYDYFFKMTDALLSENVASVLLCFDDIINKGFEGNQLINGLAGHFRNLLVCKNPKTIPLLQSSEAIAKRYEAQSNAAPPSFLISALNICSNCDVHYRMSKNQRLHVEIALIKMCHLTAALELPVAHLLKDDPPAGRAVSGKSAAESGTVDQKKNDAIGANSQTAKEGQNPPASKLSSTDAETVEKHLEETHPEEKKQDAEDMQLTEPEVEPVKVTPIPKQPEKAKDSGNVKVPPRKSTNALQEKRVDFDLSSLNQVAVPTDSDPNRKLTEEELLGIWNQYGEQQDSARVKAAFNNCKPTVEDNVIRVQAASNIELSMLNTERRGFMTFLQERVKIDQLEFEECELDPNAIQDSGPAIPVSTREKYDAMVEKNPALESLRQNLKLDFEY